MTIEAPTTENRPDEIKRFGRADRLEHILMVITFTGLAVTGLPQKFVDAGISQLMIRLMGGIETVRIIHRVMATGMMAGAIIHGGSATYKLFVLRKPPYMLPTLKDLFDMWNTFRFNIGLGVKEHPRMGRFNFEEKAEYWALVWGTIVMIITGFMLWNPIATTNLLPGEIIPAALAAHSGEALLAVLAIIIYHLYNVLSNANFSIFTLWINRGLAEEKHAIEIEAIDKGDIPQAPEPDVYKKRMRVFIPYAVVVTLLLTAGLIWFVTFEQTAITTVPGF